MNERMAAEIRKGKRTRARMMRFIVKYFKDHKYAPSYREIADGSGLKSTSEVKRHIDKLFATGLLETDLEDRYSVPRAFRVSKKYNGEMPL